MLQLRDPGFLCGIGNVSGAGEDRGPFLESLDIRTLRPFAVEDVAEDAHGNALLVWLVTIVSMPNY